MTLTDQAIGKIKAMILAGELREAVKALEIIHVLDVRRGDGTYVTSLKPDLLLRAMSFVIDIHQDSSVLELFAVRRILEPAAAVMATAHAGPADVARLRDLLAEVGASTPVDDLVAHDLVFHHSICELSGNAYLTSLLDGLSGRTLRARVWRGLTEEGSVERTLTEHRAIVDAIDSGDTELVRSRVTVHVSGVAESLQHALG